MLNPSNNCIFYIFTRFFLQSAFELATGFSKKAQKWFPNGAQHPNVRIIFIRIDIIQSEIAYRLLQFQNQLWMLPGSCLKV